MTDPVLTGTVGDDRGRLRDVRSFGDFGVAHALAQIKNDYDVTAYVKPKALLKFGRTNNADSGVKTTIATFQGNEVNETFATGNTIDRIISDSTSDGETVTIEGHTLSGSDFTFVTQNVTLNGQTAVTLTTPLARATRAFNTAGTELAGNVYVYENVTTTAGVPDTAANTKLMIAAGEQQSEKAATTISKDDYWIVTQVFGSVNRGNSANVDMALEVRESGGVFRPKVRWTIRSTGQNALTLPITPHVIVPSNADVRLVGVSDSANTTVDGWINGYLALDQA